MKTKMTLNETVREALGIALLQLMQTKQFSEITVREIATVAGVSRSSFYRNFNAKEDMLREYITTLYRNAFHEAVPLPSFSDPEQMQRFLEPRFRFIKEHREIYRTLYRHKLLYFFFEQSEQELIRLLCGPDNSLSPYHRAMLSGACAGIIRCWVENDFEDDEVIMAMRFSNPYRDLLSSKSFSDKLSDIETKTAL